MFMSDRLTLDAPRRTKEGFLAVRAKAARSGVYDYLGTEVDPGGTHFKADQIVKVYRPAEEVFDKASIGSFLAKPITNDHPTEAVTAANWRDHTRGAIMGALKDGEYLAFDLTLMDASAIEAVDSGKCELSNGYACDLSFETGAAPDGTAYQAVQRKIRGNHVAIVAKGRAGAACRIGDAALCDAIPEFIDRRKTGLTDDISFVSDLNRSAAMPHTLIIDGLQVPNVSDEAKAAIEKLQGQISAATTAKDAAEAKVAEHVTAISTKDAEIVTLKQAVEDGKVSPAQLRDAGKAFEKLVGDAKRLLPALAITDAMDEPAIKKAVVSAKLGDAAKDFTDAQIDVSFATLAATLPAVGTKDAVRDVITNIPANVVDAATIRDAARASRYAQN